jgi:hypothetical protein
MAADMKITAFWDTAPCSLIEIDRRFRNAGQFLQDSLMVKFY